MSDIYWPTLLRIHAFMDFGLWPWLLRWMSTSGDDDGTTGIVPTANL